MMGVDFFAVVEYQKKQAVDIAASGLKAAFYYQNIVFRVLIFFRAHFSPVIWITF
jgi:hypothetical protein